MSASVIDSMRCASMRDQSGSKRSSYVALALMGTASFAATFAAGSMFLNWRSPLRPAAAATQQSCVTRADGSQNCQRADSGWRSRVYYYFAWPERSTPSSRSADAGSARFTNSETQVMRKTTGGTVRRSGFGSYARSISIGRISVGG